MLQGGVECRGPSTSTSTIAASAESRRRKQASGRWGPARSVWGRGPQTKFGGGVFRRPLCNSVGRLGDDAHVVITPRLPPADSRSSYESVPHTVMLKAPVLVASWLLVAQVGGVATPPRNRSTWATSYSPVEPAGGQPVTVPRQAMSTSEKSLSPRTRVSTTLVVE